MASDGERNPETAQGTTETSRDKEGGPQSPRHQAVSVVVNAANSTGENGGNAKDNKKHPLEYFAVFFALVAAMGGCVAAGFAWYQGWVARDTETRYLRAYAMVESSVIGIDPSGKPNVSVTIKNFGLTPVYNFRHWACALVRDFPDRDDDFPTASMMTAALAPESLIAPSGTILKVYIGTCFLNESISDPVRAEIKTGRKAVFAIGVMKYKDAFGADRETRYRRAWNDVIQGVDGHSGNCADSGCPNDK